MITTQRPAYYKADRIAKYCGLSGDDKTIIVANNGDEFYEIDTAKVYRYNVTGRTWVEQPKDGEPVDTAVPPMSSETTGRFLSNDGAVTHWQEIASKNFVITLEESSEGEYTADKTWVEIKTAYDAQENLVVRIDNAEMPMLTAQVLDANNAVFSFGYVEVVAGEQMVQTHGYTYSVIDGDDGWVEDVDTADLSEYLSLSGGNMSGNIDMGSNRITNVELIAMDSVGTGGLYIGAVNQPSGTTGARLVGVYGSNAAAFVRPDAYNQYVPVAVGEPEYNYQAATKKYADDAVAKCVQAKTATTGQIKAYVQNGANQDVLLVSSTGASNALVRYGGEGRITVSAEPTADSHVANKSYVDGKVSALSTVVETVSNVASSALGLASDAAPKTLVESNTAYKKAVSVGASASVNVHMDAGVYLVTVGDANHKGLLCVTVYANDESIDSIIALDGWTCTKMPTNNRGIVIGNSTTTAMTAYITSIGAGVYK